MTNQRQIVLDALEIAEKHLAYVEITEAIAIMRKMMQAEPVLEVVRMPDHWDGRYFRDDGGSYISESAISKLPIGTLLYTAPQAVPAVHDPFEKYLKEGETPIQRLEREIKDGRALMTVYGKALGQIQELQQQQDTPVAFYDIAHDEDGEIEYEFSAYPRPGFRPLFAQAIAAAPAGWTEAVTVNLVREVLGEVK